MWSAFPFSDDDFVCRLLCVVGLDVFGIALIRHTLEFMVMAEITDDGDASPPRAPCKSGFLT